MPPFAIGGMLVRPISTHPACAQPLDRERVALCDEVGERGRTRRDGETLRQERVLRGVRDAVERPERAAFGATEIGCRSLGPRVGIAHDHRVERGVRAGRVVRVDAGEVGLEQLDGGDRAGLECGAELGDRRLDDGNIRLLAAGRRLFDRRRAHPSPACRRKPPTLCAGAHRATAGCCWVMQWMPPPPAKIGRASIVTARRPG